MSVFFNLVNGARKKIKKGFKNKYQKIGLNWLEVRKIKNLSNDRLHTISFLGCPFSFYSKDEFIHSVDEIFLEEIYSQKLRENPLIIDCGANIGLSVLYFKKRFPDAKVIAFEPDTKNFSLLQKNASSFSLENVELRQEAVWISNTTISLKSEGTMMSKIQESSTTQNNNIIDVKAVRLKDLLDQPVDFLKIDIEGAEYKVLMDIQDMLDKVHHLFLEYHGTFEQNNELNKILNVLTEKGFKYYIKSAIDKHPTPFQRKKSPDYDVQLNIFCFRDY